MQTPQVNIGTHRNGLRGILDSLDGNGFATFNALSGARFTVHNAEVLLDSATKEQAKATRTMWATWPQHGGPLSIRVERKRGRSPSLIVQRMPQSLAQHVKATRSIKARAKATML
jgi:hypothetical protein